MIIEALPPTPRKKTTSVSSNTALQFTWPRSKLEPFGRYSSLFGFAPSVPGLGPRGGGNTREDRGHGPPPPSRRDRTGIRSAWLLSGRRISKCRRALSPLPPCLPPRSLGRGRVAASAGFSGLGSVFLRFPFHAKTGFGKPCRARSLLLVLLFSLFVGLLSCRIHLGLECLQIISLLARPPSETKGRTKMKPDLRN